MKKYKINFVTTNAKKFQTGKSKVDGYTINLVQRKLDPPEIQSQSNQEIAEHSAKYAAEKIGQPVLVTDASFEIPALNGFPGPFIKFSNKYFSPDDYLNLLKGKKNRLLVIRDCLTFCEPGKKPKSFQSELHATIAKKSANKKNETAIQNIFIPKGDSRIMSTIPKKEQEEFWVQNLSMWEDLLVYLLRRKLIEKK